LSLRLFRAQVQNTSRTCTDRLPGRASHAPTEFMGVSPCMWGIGPRGTPKSTGQQPPIRDYARPEGFWNTYVRNLPRLILPPSLAIIVIRNAPCQHQNGILPETKLKQADCLLQIGQLAGESCRQIPYTKEGAEFLLQICHQSGRLETTNNNLKVGM
jgi:hypothetical protein